MIYSLSLLQRFDPTAILISVLVLSLSLSVHEYAHARAAFALGDDTAALQGRLSLNPLVHLDLMGSIVFLIAGIGWAKPVPVNPRRFTSKLSQKTGLVLTSLAGPLSNLVLAALFRLLSGIVLLILLASNKSADFVPSFVWTIFFTMYRANILLAVFNLLPLPPLDGFKIFGGLMPNRVYYKIMEYERYIGMAFFFLFLFGRGVLSSILSTIMIPFNYIIAKPIDGLIHLIARMIS